MISRSLLGQAVQPLCRHAHTGQRAVWASVQSSSQQLFTSTPMPKPDNRASASSPRAFSSGSATEQQQQRTGPATPERVYTSFAIYKTRAALSVSLLPPAFATSDNGYKRLDRDGVMLLEFANANPGQPAAGGPPPAGGINRTYNWGAKVTFALSPVELGNIMAGDAIASDKGLTMFHDPAKIGKTGEPLKKLMLKQMADGAVSFNLSAGPDNFSVPVSRGEFEVLKSLAHFAIPRLLGFDVAFAS